MVRAISFLPLPENRFALTAIERLKVATAASPCRLVYLHGPTGLGKTRLVEQLCRDVRRANPKVRIEQTCGVDLAERLDADSEDGSLPLTMRRMAVTPSADRVKRGQTPPLDIFVCEDLAVFGHRPMAQQGFRFLLDALLASGARILLTGKESPGALHGFSHRMLTRLRGGVCAAIKPLGEASRLRFVQHICEQRQLPLLDAAAMLLARELAVSPRELEGAIAQLEARSRMENAVIDRRLVQDLLRNEIRVAAPAIEEIAKAVAEHFGVSLTDLQAAGRDQAIALPRQYAMYLSRRLTSEPLREICRYFDRRNHSTVVHACTHVEELLESDFALQRDLSQICVRLGTAPLALETARVED